MIVDGSALVDTKVITLAPAGEEVAGWKLVDTKFITLAPSEEEIAGWKLLYNRVITLGPPIIECSTDSDCPEGYVCEGGMCVKKEAGFPWVPLAIGAVAIGGIIFLSSGREEEKEEAKEEVKEGKKE